MKKLALILTGLLLLISFLIPSHFGTSQSTRPDAAQITHFLNEHPLTVDSGAQVLNVTLQGEALVINLSQAVLPEETYDEAIFQLMMLKLNEFRHNHHPSGVNMLVNFIRRGFSVVGSSSIIKL